MNTTSSYNKRYQQAESLYNQEQYHEAQQIFESLMKDFPDKAGPIYGYGVCLLAVDKRALALSSFIKASELEPNNAKYFVYMGHCLNCPGDENLAIIQYDKALQIDKDNLSALTELGRLYLTRRRDTEAAELLKRAVEIKPSNADNQAHLAMALARIGEYEESVKHVNKAIRLKPKDHYGYYILGNTHLTFGDQIQAAKAFKKAIEVDPYSTPSYFALVQAQKVTDKNDPLLRKMENALKHSMPTSMRILLLQALAKAYDDSKEPEKAFSFAEKANMLVRSEFDLKSHNRNLGKIRKTFNKRYFVSSNNSVESPYTPIFIVGMPRSGSTLIDQILSTHTKVESVGESLAMHDIVHEIELNSNKTTKFPECLDALDDTQLELYRESYIKKIARNTTNTTHIVDKNLFNYRNLGLIAKLFPKARIIHARRHPLDTSFSCYITGFSITEDTWTHNMEHIGAYYRGYKDLMEHWHKVLPIPILDIDYENMVQDTESNTKRILEFCNLEWEDECLEFYNTKRAVNTASIWQVRQPVYKSSMQRWVPYAKHLQPMILALGDVLEADYEKFESLGLKHGPRHNSPRKFVSKLFK